MADTLHTLSTTRSITTGQLYKQLFPREQMERNDFEAVLGALASAGLVASEDAVFEKEGRSINYRKLSLTRDGEDVDEHFLATLPIKDGSGEGGEASKPRLRSASSKTASPAKTANSAAANSAIEDENPLSGRAAELWEKLRLWRIEEARELGVRAFHILGNRTLRAVALAQPESIDQLRNVPGIGPAKAKNFGEAICRICSN